LSGRRSAPILLLALLLGACGSSTGSAGHLPGSTGQPALSAKPVPAPTGLAASGKLTVAADPTEAPLVYYDHNNRFAGFSIELLGEIASEMALKLDVINIDSSQIVPGLADVQHRYDVGVATQPASADTSTSALTLNYLVGGQAILAGQGQGAVKTLADLCGLRLGANRGTAGETAVLRQNEGACSSRPINLTLYDNDVTGIHDVQSGKLAAYVDDYTVATAFATIYTNIRLVPNHFDRTPEVFLFSLTNTELHDAVSKAFDRLRQKGAYKQLLKRWGLSEGAVS
jgi:polar amino acid transport system substrate-binding protein